MKKFVLEEILIMSTPERTARRLKFHPKTTVLLGENDTGKSSLIKTIYWTFGSEPAVIHPEWKKLNIVSVVKFSVDNKSYFILRKENFFALFDGSKNLINKYTSVTKELGPELAKMFDFNLKLRDKNGIEITPPPAFYLMPFYLDQDSSWNNSWSSFTSLDYIPNWKKSIIEFHVGLKTYEGYKLKSQKDKINMMVQSLNSEKGIYEKAFIEIQKEDGGIDFDINIDEYKKEIEELLVRLNTLKELEQKIKIKLIDYLNHKNNILLQINIVKKALKEVKKEYDFAFNQQEIECPTCGQHYENSFAERFSIAQDQYRCSELLSELEIELIDINNKIEKEELDKIVNIKSIEEINIILAQKRGKLTLKELIMSEGRRQMRDFIKEKIYELGSKIAIHDAEVEIIEKDQRDLAKIEAERKDRINQTYLSRMRTYLEDLNVKMLAEDSYKDLRFNIKETGSDRPRALLAYYYTVLSLAKEYSPSVFAPIIIDSPKQQDPDETNWQKMLNFIRDRRIDDSQLILSLSDLGRAKINFDGNVIHLKEKHKLLSQDIYPEIFDEISPLLDKSLFDNE